MLYRHLRWDLNHSYITENIYLWNWESDMISVTDAGYLREYEIKLNLSDYRQDFKKRKHDIFKGGQTNKPSQFWFVIHGFKLGYGDVPEYAGLMEMVKNKNSGRYYKNIIKPAPRISNVQISDKQKLKLYYTIYNRYWNLRIKSRR